jgi:Icc-related predicted phosphoesterase
MKIQLLSDLHIEFGDYRYRPTDADVVVLAGDIHVGVSGVVWASAHIKDKPVIYVLGNHEYYRHVYPQLTDMLKETTAGTNIHVLENDVFSYQGVNFLGSTLWTDFAVFGDPREASFHCEHRMNDFKKIQFANNPADNTPMMVNNKLKAVDVARIHDQSLSWLAANLEQRQGENNVVITHHGPTLESLPEHRLNDLISAGYVSNLSNFIHQYQPSAWVHGHLHSNSDYLVGQCRVMCNPRGYSDRANPEFDSRFCFDV